MICVRRVRLAILRAALVLAGLAIAAGGIYALHDGSATLGIPGRNLQPASQIAKVDSWPEVLVTGLVVSALSALFLTAGISPRTFLRSPIVPLLFGLAFVLLVAIPYLTSAG